MSGSWYGETQKVRWPWSVCTTAQAAVSAVLTLTDVSLSSRDFWKGFVHLSLLPERRKPHDQFHAPSPIKSFLPLKGKEVLHVGWRLGSDKGKSGEGHMI